MSTLAPTTPTAPTEDSTIASLHNQQCSHILDYCSPTVLSHLPPDPARILAYLQYSHSILLDYRTIET